MLIVPATQVQAIFEGQPLRQPSASPDSGPLPAAASTPGGAEGTVEYRVLQEDDGEVD